LREAVSDLARNVASKLAPGLEERLSAFYGPNWLGVINSRRAASGHSRGRGLHDHRFCLAIFGRDESTEGWADERWRRLARELNILANKAAHDEIFDERELERAREISAWFISQYIEPAGGSRHSNSTSSVSNERDDEQDQTEKEAAKVRRWIAEDPSDRQLKKLLYHLYSQAERWQDALPAAEQWQRCDPSDQDAVAAVSMALFNLQRWPEAITVLRHLVRIAPEREIYWRALTTAGDKSGNDDALIEGLAGWLSFESENADMWRIYAMLLKKRNQFVEAAEAAERSLRLNFDDGKAHEIYAETLAILKRWPEAMHGFREAARRSPGDARLWRQMHDMASKCDDHEAQLEAEIGWTAAAPDDYAAWLIRCIHATAMGRWNDVLISSRRVLELGCSRTSDH
jgi:tetratricopeptide (TPR) repeat protein